MKGLGFCGNMTGLGFWVQNPLAIFRTPWRFYGGNTLLRGFERGCYIGIVALAQTSGIMSNVQTTSPQILHRKLSQTYVLQVLNLL